MHLLSLFLACFWGFHDVVKTLLDKGAGMLLYWTAELSKLFLQD